MTPTPQKGPRGKVDSGRVVGGRRGKYDPIASCVGTPDADHVSCLPAEPTLAFADLQEWVPPGHLAHHVSDVVDALDLSVLCAHEGDGRNDVDDGQGADAYGRALSRAVARKLEEECVSDSRRATIALPTPRRVPSCLWGRAGGARDAGLARVRQALGLTRRCPNASRQRTTEAARLQRRRSSPRYASDEGGDGGRIEEADRWGDRTSDPQGQGEALGFGIRGGAFGGRRVADERERTSLGPSLPPPYGDRNFTDAPRASCEEAAFGQHRSPVIGIGQRRVVSWHV